MCKKLTYLLALVFVLCVVVNASAELVGHWKFDESSGKTASDSIAGNDGTLWGNPKWVAGWFGNALEFDGDDWVDCGDILNIADAITIACWVNPAGLDGRNGWVARRNAYSFKSHRYESHGKSYRKVVFETPGVSYVTGNIPLVFGEWQHVAVTFVPNQTDGVIFYLNGVEGQRMDNMDGVEAQRMDSTAMSAGGGPFGIGNNRWTQFYEGMIDDVRVYNHILTEVEQTCNHLIIIAGGRIAATGTPAELRQRVIGPSRIIAEMRGPDEAELVQAVKTIKSVKDVTAERHGNWTRLTISHEPKEDPRAELAKWAAEKGYQLRELRRQVGSLEDFFIQITYEQNVQAGQRLAASA